MDLSQLHFRILPVLKKAEQIALDNFGKSSNVRVKTEVASQASLVTETDEKIDSLFREKLLRLFPEYGFITEENEKSEIKEFNWIIDPIDGTTNYSRGYPLFGISVSLWKLNTPVYGCISLPIMKQVIYGYKGGGVFINEEKLYRNDEDYPKPFIFLAPVAGPQDHGDVIRRIGEGVAAPRDFGSSVYQAYETIKGNADAAIAYKLSIWDIGAAVLLAKEAGLAVRYVTPYPDITNLKDYSHTLIFGKEILVNKLHSALS